MQIKKLCIVVSSPFTLEVFLVPQIQALSKLYEVTVIVNTRDAKLLEKLGVDAKLISVPLERKIRPLRDAYALLILFRIFRIEKYDLVHSVTPKAGLLSMAAAFLARIPVRIHTFTGQVWGTHGGLSRLVLKLADRVTALFATDILVDSASQRDFIVKEKVLPRHKAHVLSHGSISGVNVVRFRPDPALSRTMRQYLGIPPDAFVVLYMARLTRDKGALVMAEGFAAFGSQDNRAHLIVVGPDEELLRPAMRRLCASCLERVHFVDVVHDPENYMACVFCLPSYREGFGSALINAAAVGIPAIASDIYGSSDAVADGVTGFLFPAGDSARLAELLARLARSPEFRLRLGQQARERAVRDFAEELLTTALLQFYRERLPVAEVGPSP